jgi:predicted RNA-binding Zn-ribbon protein involved in translation (DUF1610 family)
MSQSGDVLDRFIETLVQQITARYPEYLTGSFTVAEIYQDLVPYRFHRDSIGVEMNGDYEDALARMLSGEGDYLLLDSETARRELQVELAGRNPNTSMFREFASESVRLHPSRVPNGAGAGDWGRAEAAEDDTIEGTEGMAKAEDSSSEDSVVGHIETATVPPVVPLSGPQEEEVEPSGVRAGNPVTVCHSCRAALPGNGSVHFCPFCGSDLRLLSCPLCGEALEARWQFCAYCGANVRA